MCNEWFFIWRKNVLFLRYLDFCVFVKSTDFQTRDVIMCVATCWKSHLCLFLSNPDSYQNEFGQIQECCITNFSNMFLVQCWGLEGSSNPFYDFIKITIWQDLAIFNNIHLPFWYLLYSPFQKNETLESCYKRLLSNRSRLLNWKGPRT